MQNYKCKLELSNAKEAKNSPIDGEEVRPQALDQSYKETKKISISKAFKISSKLTKFSKSSLLS
jgi:hypothetical protein